MSIEFQGSDTMDMNDADAFLTLQMNLNTKLVKMVDLSVRDIKMWP